MSFKDYAALYSQVSLVQLYTVEPRFNEVAGDRVNMFINWLNRGFVLSKASISRIWGENDQNVCYIEVS